MVAWARAKREAIGRMVNNIASVMVCGEKEMGTPQTYICGLRRPSFQMPNENMQLPLSSLVARLNYNKLDATIKS